MRKSLSELLTLSTFEERFKYLHCPRSIGEDTFGCHRYLNQIFYRSPEWLNFRNTIIVRDNGCDMALVEYPIYGEIMVHHINPITLEDIQERRYDILLNPENVVCVSKDTHNLIHYGDISPLRAMYYGERSQNDTAPWKK